LWPSQFKQYLEYPRQQSPGCMCAWGQSLAIFPDKYQQPTRFLAMKGKLFGTQSVEVGASPLTFLSKVRWSCHAAHLASYV